MMTMIACDAADRSHRVSALLQARADEGGMAVALFALTGQIDRRKVKPARRTRALPARDNRSPKGQTSYLNAGTRLGVPEQADAACVRTRYHALGVNIAIVTLPQRMADPITAFDIDGGVFRTLPLFQTALRPVLKDGQTDSIDAIAAVPEFRAQVSH
jgi:hypothetical protein